jgi:hypothetical protein
LVYFIATLLLPFWYIFPILVYCIEKNLATLVRTEVSYFRHKLEWVYVCISKRFTQGTSR